MREMKKTGVAWCPIIPAIWHMGRVKDCFEIAKDTSTLTNPTVLKLARSGISIKDVSANEGQMAESYDNYNKVKIGDLLLNPMDLYSGANCNVSEKEGVISPAYANLRPKKKLHPKYYDYYFKLQYWSMAMFAHGKGVSFDNRWTINTEGIKNYEIPVPSYSEQEVIVNRINSECFKIDALIANQEAQIEKLKQYKQSLITEVVTKGLDPNAKMKDSGVEWIGEVPEAWETLRIKHSSWLKGRIGWDGLKSEEFIDDGPYLITGTDFNDGIVNWDTCVHITEDRYNEDKLLHVYNGDLLITKDGTVGKLAIITNAPDKVSLNSGVMIIRNNSKFKYDQQYMFYVLKSDVFTKWFDHHKKPGSTIQHLYQHQFDDFRYPFPSLDEQKDIAAYLEEKCIAIDALIVKKQEAINKWEEYKKSLIYYAVTGKIDCRNEAI